MSQTKILIVEDQNLIALSLKTMLEDLGYFVLEPLNSGEKAVHKVATNRPDLILMDIKLAGKMDGITAATQIREQTDTNSGKSEDTIIMAIPAAARFCSSV